MEKDPNVSFLSLALSFFVHITMTNIHFSLILALLKQVPLLLHSKITLKKLIKSIKINYPPSPLPLRLSSQYIFRSSFPFNIIVHIYLLFSYYYYSFGFSHLKFDHSFIYNIQ